MMKFSKADIDRLYQYPNGSCYMAADGTSDPGTGPRAPRTEADRDREAWHIAAITIDTIRAVGDAMIRGARRGAGSHPHNRGPSPLRSTAPREGPAPRHDPRGSASAVRGHGVRVHGLRASCSSCGAGGPGRLRRRFAPRGFRGWPRPDVWPMPDGRLFISRIGDRDWEGPLTVIETIASIEVGACCTTASPANTPCATTSKTRRRAPTSARSRGGGGGEPRIHGAPERRRRCARPRLPRARG